MSAPFNHRNTQLEFQRQRSLREHKHNMCPGYPLNAFPDFMFEAIENVFLAIQAPIPVVVQSILGYMSASAQGEVDILIAAGLTVIPASLYLVAGASSGDRKTTMDNLVSAPLYAYDRQQQEKYNEEMAEYKSSMEVWRIKEKVAAKKLKKRLEDGNYTAECEAEYKAIQDCKPVKPERQQMIFGDTTFRGITELLSETNASICLLSSEAGSIMKQLKQAAPQLNDLWGGGDIATNRVAGHRNIRSPRATLNWMVQHQYVEDLLLSATSRARSSGFAARILFSLPDSLQGYRFKEPGENKRPDLSGLHKLHEIGNRLLQKRQKNHKRTVLTIQNQYHFDQLYNSIEDELRYNGFFHDFEDAGSKLLENIARMAALFHVFSGEYEQGSTEISVQHINAAREICAWHMKQFMSLFDKNAQVVRNAHQLMDWIHAHEHLYRWRGGFSFSALLQFGPPCIRKRALLNEAIDVIQEQYPHDYSYAFNPTDGSVKYIYTKNQTGPRHG